MNASHLENAFAATDDHRLVWFPIPLQPSWSTVLGSYARSTLPSSRAMSYTHTYIYFLYKRKGKLMKLT